MLAGGDTSSHPLRELLPKVVKKTPDTHSAQRLPRGPRGCPPPGLDWAAGGFRTPPCPRGGVLNLFQHAARFSLLAIPDPVIIGVLTIDQIAVGVNDGTIDDRQDGRKMAQFTQTV